MARVFEISATRAFNGHFFNGLLMDRCLDEATIMLLDAKYLNP